MTLSASVQAPSAVGRHGAVACAHPAASAAGLAVLQAGGNAVDAAVTAAFTLTVVEPFASGIAGGGFLTLRLADGTAAMLDFRETAPAAATPTMFVEADPENKRRVDNIGYLPIGVPGQLLGMVEALARWGTITLEQALRPAIEHAERGFAVTPFMARMMGLNRTRLRLTPDGRRIFLLPDGELPAAGHRIVQPDLAETYRRIARAGPDLLYRGELARRIVDQVRANGGRLSLADFAGYRPVLREPVRGQFRGLEIISAPPPSSGGFAVALLLQMWEALAIDRRPADAAETVHLMVEAMKLVFADREHYAGDPAFVDVPVRELMAPAYARRRAALVDPARVQRPAPGDPRRGSPSTTHLSVIDGQGNAVALTQTLQDLFGSGVVVAGTGIMLNNELRDFATRDPRSPNSVQPGKRPLSSQTPTIVVRADQPALVLGSAASKRIITAVAQVILNHAGRGLPLPEAVAAPRYHADLDRDEVAAEHSAPAAVVAGLQALGHHVDLKGEGAVDPFLGGVQAVGRDVAGELTAVSDPRRGGEPAAC